MKRWIRSASLPLVLAFPGPGWGAEGMALEGSAAPPQSSCCPVVELRQYTVRPGQRDVLIELFDREFVETQEAEGMTIVGQFRDLDNPERFVWVRGFPDMAVRGRALDTFYKGPTWKAHSKAANATMVDVNNVLLLRPAAAASGFALEGLRRPAPGTSETPQGLVVATMYHFEKSPGADFLDFFERDVAPVVRAAGASILGTFVTESSPNNFPALPVREGEWVFVWFSRFGDAAAHEAYIVELGKSPRWTGEVSKALASRLKRGPETLRLAPSARSLLR